MEDEQTAKQPETLVAHLPPLFRQLFILSPRLRLKLEVLHNLQVPDVPQQREQVVRGYRAEIGGDFRRIERYRARDNLSKLGDGVHHLLIARHIDLNNISTTSPQSYSLDFKD
jgi:hypothetical protein